jgi:urease accessory protein
MNRRICVVLMLILSVPSITLAHSGHGVFSGFISGFGHPLTGFDHLLAMLAVGLWAGYLGGRSMWIVPVTFIVVMAVGGLWGMSGFTVPFVEQGILLSILVLGFLLASALKLPLVYGSAIVGFFALFHGLAHGSEAPMATGTVTYLAGFLAATALLHSTGLSLGLLIDNLYSGKIGRLVGGAIMLCGLYLAAS